jgi:hypothetical protein
MFTIKFKRRFLMKARNCIVLVLLTLLVVAGCASTKVTSRDQQFTGKLPRPATIWVNDFAATPADVPKDSAIAGVHSEHPETQTAEQIETGRKLGAEIASELIERINQMGMSAKKAEKGAAPQVNDILIRGYLVSFAEGSKTKRLLIGFGSGATHLQVAAEGFQVTPQGLRKLGSGTTDSGGSKTPGAGLGIVALAATHNPAGLIISSGVKIYDERSGKSTVEGRAKQTADEIAGVLKQRFQEQGWID